MARAGELQVQLKLRRHARWLLAFSGWLRSRVGLYIPHGFVMWVYRRSWLMSADNGVTWASVRLAPDGRVIR